MRKISTIMLVSMTLLFLAACNKQNSVPMPPAVNSSVKIDVAAATAEVAQLELQKEKVKKPAAKTSGDPVTVVVDQLPNHLISNGQPSLIADMSFAITGDSTLYLPSLTFAVGSNITFGTDYAVFVNGGDPVVATVTVENGVMTVAFRSPANRPLNSSQVNSVYVYGIPYGISKDTVSFSLAAFNISYKSRFYVNPVTFSGRNFFDKFK